MSDNSNADPAGNVPGIAGQDNPGFQEEDEPQGMVQISRLSSCGVGLILGYPRCMVRVVSYLCVAYATAMLTLRSV